MPSSLSGKQMQKIREMWSSNSLDHDPLFRYYRDDGYFVINNCLRYNILTPRFITIINRMINTIMELPPLQKEITVYRGLRFDEKFVIGSYYQELGFMSTSYVELMARRISDKILEIRLPTSTPFAFLELELEILLPPRAKFVITNIEDEGNILMDFIGFDPIDYQPNYPEVPNTHHMDDITYLYRLMDFYNIHKYDLE